MHNANTENTKIHDVGTVHYKQDKVYKEGYTVYTIRGQGSLHIFEHRGFKQKKRTISNAKIVNIVNNQTKLTIRIS